MGRVKRYVAVLEGASGREIVVVRARSKEKALEQAERIARPWKLRVVEVEELAVWMARKRRR